MSGKREELFSIKHQSEAVNAYEAKHVLNATYFITDPISVHERDDGRSAPTRALMTGLRNCRYWSRLNRRNYTNSRASRISSVLSKLQVDTITRQL